MGADTPSDPDLELLRRHAPVLRFDSRELFFPTEVDRYIAACSLAVNGDIVANPGQIDPDDLDHRLGPNCYLQFITESDRRMVVRTEAKRLARKLFGPRLGRVGLFGRILDALFLLSVFVRPTTPRLTTAAAAIKVERLQLNDEPIVYGRVGRVGGWLVLHYAYFYAMNDWRSGYRGLNDHEADWEQAWIMCDPLDQRPVWVAASSHDHAGADLRRHWDDPECRKVGDQPVLFVGAGSHALYFRPGDYVTRIDVQPLRWLLRLQRWIRRALRIRDDAAERGLGPALGMPFVDAATGDGREEADWTVKSLDDDRCCFGQYRGLWGLDTGDPTNGERGPSGPKFDREGEVRLSWADPVGFAGLHGVGPPSRAESEARLDNLSSSLVQLNEEIDRLSQILPLIGNPTVVGNSAAVRAELSEESDRLSELRRQRTVLTDMQKRLERGQRVERDNRAHLQSPAVPMAPPQEAGIVLAVWAALSVPLLMLAVAAVLLFDGLGIATLLLATAAGFSIFEQLVRRHYRAVFRLIVVYLLLAVLFVVVGAVFAGVLSLSVIAIGGVIAAAAVVLFVANLGELTAIQRRAEAVADEEGTELSDSANGGVPGGASDDVPGNVDGGDVPDRTSGDQPARH